MTGYLLDTNVVSALRIRGRNPQVEEWTRTIPTADQFIAASSVAEIERGIVSRERTDAAQGPQRAAVARLSRSRVRPPRRCAHRRCGPGS